LTALVVGSASGWGWGSAAKASASEFILRAHGIVGLGKARHAVRGTIFLGICTGMASFDRVHALLSQLDPRTRDELRAQLGSPMTLHLLQMLPPARAQEEILSIIYQRQRLQQLEQRQQPVRQQPYSEQPGHHRQVRPLPAPRQTEEQQRLAQDNLQKQKRHKLTLLLLKERNLIEVCKQKAPCTHDLETGSLFVLYRSACTTILNHLRVLLSKSHSPAVLEKTKASWAIPMRIPSSILKAIHVYLDKNDIVLKIAKSDKRLFCPEQPEMHASTRPVSKPRFFFFCLHVRIHLFATSHFLGEWQGDVRLPGGFL
jgi:hypothetical protein